jgi:hypothetical protein
MHSTALKPSRLNEEPCNNAYPILSVLPVLGQGTGLRVIGRGEKKNILRNKVKSMESFPLGRRRCSFLDRYQLLLSLCAHIH